ncbi:CPA1 family monovalent cation:H+ antiporter [Pseudomonas sp. PvP001]
MLEIVATFICLTTLLTYVNFRFIGLPPTIGVMVTALMFSLILQGLSFIGYPGLEDRVEALMNQIDFGDLLMNWMLSFLLFAGALHVNLADLRNYRWPIGLLATFGVLIATFVIGTLAFWIFGLFGWHVSFLYCLLFGALISPTDPIAVLGVLRTANASKPLKTTIVGESLFNDGTAVVVFTVLLGIAQLGETPTVGATAMLFLHEAVGGVLFGGLIGYIVYRMIKSIEQYQVEVMLTLALVIGGSAMASELHVSAPIAMVVAGLIIGNLGRNLAMNDMTRRYMDGFWELLDDILNALLFALIGLELLLLPFSWGAAPVGGLPARRGDPAVAVAHRGPGDSAAAALSQRSARHHSRAHLGRPARRRLGRPGPGPAHRPGARPAAEHHLHRRAVLDPAARPEHRQAGQGRHPRARHAGSARALIQ